MFKYIQTLLRRLLKLLTLAYHLILAFKSTILNSNSVKLLNNQIDQIRASLRIDEDLLESKLTKQMNILLAHVNPLLVELRPTFKKINKILIPLFRNKNLGIILLVLALFFVSLLAYYSTNFSMLTNTLFLIKFGLVLFLLISFQFFWLSFDVITKFLSMFWFLLVLFSTITIYKVLLLPSNQLFSSQAIFHAIRWDCFGFWDLNYITCLDSVTIFYVFTIAIISLFANIHSLVYMSDDQRKERFIFFLNAFAFSMVLLVISRHFLTILLCWELLGVTSFILITHNDTQLSSLRSAFKAFGYNKISDIALALAAIIFIFMTGSFNLTTESIELLQFDNVGSYDWRRIPVLLFLWAIFIGASVKSVQFVSYFWLPDSMKAPAPASALIHSATLVAAGFYLLALLKPVWTFYWSLDMFVLIGFLTAMSGAFTAVFQNDLKKTLAFSTVANCGFMLVLLSMCDVRVFLIYFVAHGLFKSNSFMFAGEIIIRQFHTQDVRRYYNLVSNFHKSTIGIVLSLLSLAGTPISLVFTLKHMFHVPIQSDESFILYDAFFYLYSFLSLCYALSCILKIYYFNYNSKEYEHEFGYSGDTDRCMITLLYGAISTMVCYVMLMGFSKFNVSNHEIMTNVEHLITLTLINLMIPITLGLTYIYWSTLDKTPINKLLLNFHTILSLGVWANFLYYLIYLILGMIFG